MTATQVFMYDSTNEWAIPSTAKIVAYYEYGDFANYNAAKAAHPNAVLVPIDPRGVPGSLIYDCEPGAVWPPSKAASLAAGDRQAGKYPTIYMSISNITAVTGALAAVGLHFSLDLNDPHGCFMFAAGYTDTPYLYPGSAGTQFEGGITAPYDITETNGIWPYCILGLTPPGLPGPLPLSTGATEIIGFAPSFDGKGGWYADNKGAVFQKGDAEYLGGVNKGAKGAPASLNQPIVAIMSHPSKMAYWLVAADGGIFPFGTAFEGSTGNVHLNKPIVGGAPSPTGNGYWLVASDGGVFEFGDARPHGSLGSTQLNKPVVGMSGSPDGGGYWLVASDGGIFPFGDAGFHGSLGNVKLNQPAVGMTSTPAGDGYWIVAADGGVFPMGAAKYFGSTGNVHLNEPINHIAHSHDGKGYWLTATDGGMFNFGDAEFLGASGAV